MSPMLSGVAASARLRAALLTLCLIGGAVVAVTLPTRTSSGAPAADVVVDLSFADDANADRFTTSGAGKWRVEAGRYELVGLTGRQLRPARRPFSLLRSPLARSAWTLRVRAKPAKRGGEFLVVLWSGSPDDYVYLHFGRTSASSGVYAVTGGHQRLLQPLAAKAMRGRWQLVELRRKGDEVKIYRGGASHGVSYLGTAGVDLPTTLRAGLGSWGSKVAFDDLEITASPSTPGSVPSASHGASHSAGQPSVPSIPPVTAPIAPTITPAPGGRDVRVATSAELTTALAGARPGDVITMADGVYTSKGLKAPLVIGGKQYVGTFVGSASGTASAPIVLQGSRNAVIDGKPGEVGTGTQYGLYLAGADHWIVDGITVRNVAKGIVLDESDHTTIQNVAVTIIGQEGVHLRALSSDNVVRNNVISYTGQKNETYGEGIYVGSANSNWGTYTDGQPDASDRNQLLGNDISHTGAEDMDLKEGSSGGLVQGNTFDGADMTGSWADSWIDLKGNYWMVTANHGSTALLDGFQVHQALAGWGIGNVFGANAAAVNGPGYGFWLHKEVTGDNTVRCDNTVTGAGSGFANVACVP